MNPDLPRIRRTFVAARHLLEMYRRQLQDTTARRQLQGLDNRLLEVAGELDQFVLAEKLEDWPVPVKEALESFEGSRAHWFTAGGSCCFGHF